MDKEVVSLREIEKTVEAKTKLSTVIVYPKPWNLRDPPYLMALQFVWATDNGSRRRLPLIDIRVKPMLLHKASTPPTMHMALKLMLA